MITLDLIKNNHFKKTWGSLEPKSMNLVTDSRLVNKDSFFIALAGERHDAFKFARQVVEAECSFFVFNLTPEREKVIEDLSKKFPSVFFAGVDDTTKYLQELAVLKRKSFEKRNGLIIGLTGSNGKTTTKEMLGFLLESCFENKVCMTKGNLNNHLGVPFTILGLEEKHEVLIVEMGMNHPGEIEFLCNIANPVAGLITNVGEAHIEFLKSKEGIFLEKSALFRHVNKKHGVFVIPKNDDYLSKLKGDKLIKTEMLNLENLGFFETYNILNMSLALELAQNLFPEKKDELLGATANFEMPKNNRSQWVTLNQTLVFLDAYNANPSSMREALKSFLNSAKEKNINSEDQLFILGDMNELGENSETFHNEIGQFLKESGVINACFVGKFANSYREGFGKAAKTYLTRSEFEKSSILAKKLVFIKGSRSLQLESLLDITI